MPIPVLKSLVRKNKSPDKACIEINEYVYQELIDLIKTKLGSNWQGARKEAVGEYLIQAMRQGKNPAKTLEECSFSSVQASAYYQSKTKHYFGMKWEEAREIILAHPEIHTLQDFHNVVLKLQGKILIQSDLSKFL